MDFVSIKTAPERLFEIISHVFHPGTSLSLEEKEWRFFSIAMHFLDFTFVSILNNTQEKCEGRLRVRYLSENDLSALLAAKRSMAYADLRVKAFLNALVEVSH